ncbi:MAG: protein-disulfide reductase DsbD N-terminal domain-containing protein [Chloroflexi bacterium]|nr:protein-disulfide reductase DsbD N-terminal domain-containing protein [Chloroflexota bacterium]
MLSDVTGDAIASLGLLDDSGPAPSAKLTERTSGYRRGLVHPASFIVDREGRVVEIQQDQSYRPRPAAVTILETSFDGESSLAGVRAEAETEDLRIAVSCSSPTYRRFQKLRLRVAIAIAPGLHVYATPVPAGYAALSVEIEPLAELETGSAELPEPRPYELEGLGERFFVYKGAIVGALPFTFGANVGDVSLAVRVSYQACSDTVCFPPSTVELRVPLIGLDHIEAD